MDTSAGPPPGLDRELVAFGVEVARTRGLAVLKELSDELDLLGSPAYQRVLAERPGFREYADYKWSAQSPVMWAQLIEDIVGQPDQLAELAALHVPVLGIVGDEDTTFLQPMRDIVGDRAGRRARGRARCRPLAAVREPADLAGGDGELPGPRPALSGAGRPRVSRRRPSP